MSGQCSSAIAVCTSGKADNFTSRLSTLKNMWLTSSCSPLPNNCGHFRGFLALATFPSELSTSA